MKNKFLWILTIIILLVSVFSVNIFAFYPGVASEGSTIYSDATFLKASSVFFTQLDSSDNYFGHDEISIGLSDAKNLFLDTRIELFSQSGIYFNFMNREPASSSTVYQTDIELGLTDVTSYFGSFGMRYHDSSISFNNVDTLRTYLLSTDACPCYITAVPSSLSGLKMSGNVKIYNGNNVIADTVISVESDVLSSAYSRLVKPFLYSIRDWLSTLDLFDNGWLTFSLEDVSIETTSQQFDMQSLDFIRLGVHLPTNNPLPDGLTFRSVAETSVVTRYDLNPLDFIWDTLTSLFSIELFPLPFSDGQIPFTIGNLLSVLLGLFGFVGILKFFSGG